MVCYGMLMVYSHMIHIAFITLASFLAFPLQSPGWFCCRQGEMPLSKLTCASLEDIGYIVQCDMVSQEPAIIDTYYIPCIPDTVP